MNHWKSSAILVLAVVLHSNQCQALYAPPAFYQLAAGSDLIVLGRIVALSDSTFSLAVEEVLVGECPDTILRIARFQDWTCSARWKPYALGQREIAFLCRRGSGYRTNSPGAEGEWEVIGDHVACAYMGTYFRPSLESIDLMLPLEAVVYALKDFGTCFRIEGGQPGYKEKIVKLCKAREIENLVRRSKVHKYLVETMRAAQKSPFPGGTLCALDR
jgi:hypothetical protein